MPFVPNRICDNIRLTQKQDCRMATCWNSRLYDGHDDNGVRTDDDQAGDSAPITLTIVEQPRHTFCMLEPAPGACKVSTEQWFYNATEATCARFMYSGCGGNKNNFNTETECLSACHPEHDARRQRVRGLQSQSLTREGFLQDEAPLPPCVMLRMARAQALRLRVEVVLVAAAPGVHEPGAGCFRGVVEPLLGAHLASAGSWFEHAEGLPRLFHDGDRRGVSAAARVLLLLRA